MKYAFKQDNVVKAYGKDLPISRKHGYELANFLRYKPVNRVIRELEEIMKLKLAVPFKRYNGDVGHRTKIGPGRYPVKAAKYFLKVVKNAINNAKQKGLNVDELYVVHLSTHKASTPLSSGRRHRSTKRLHVQVALGNFDALPKRIQNKLNNKSKNSKLKEIKNDEKKKVEKQ